MDGRSNKRRRRNNDISITGLSDTERDEDVELDVLGSDAASDDSPNAATPSQVQTVDMSTSLAAPEKSTQSVVVGGALRRNPDGTSTAPRAVKRKTTGQKVSLQIFLLVEIPLYFPRQAFDGGQNIPRSRISSLNLTRRSIAQIPQMTRKKMELTRRVPCQGQHQIAIQTTIVLLKWRSILLL